MRIVISGIPVDVQKKNIKNMHLQVKPPDGHVVISAPLSVDDSAIEAYARTQFGFIKRSIAQFQEQSRASKRQYVSGETMYIWGKQYYLVDAPLDTCPMFAIAGSMIPTYEVMQYVGEKPYDTLNMLVFPGEGTYVHYQDNGSDFAYQDGAYNQYAFTQQENGEVTMKMMKEGYERPYKKIEYIFVGK